MVRACTVDVDHDEVVRTARAHAQAHGSGDDDSVYSSAHQYISKPENRVRRDVLRIIVNLRLIHIPRIKTQYHEPLDEDAVQNAHRQAYEQGSGQNLSASSMGSAAALQVHILALNWLHC